jgi:hypothetical protein
MILKQLTKGIRIWQKMKQQYRNQHNIMNLFQHETETIYKKNKKLT